MDGGTVWNTNLISAVDKCMELVGDKSKIIVDIAICAHHSIEPETEVGTTINNFLRFRDIKKYYAGLEDINKYMAAEPDVEFRYLMVPSIPLKSGLAELNFTADALGPMVELGKNDARTVIAKGPGFGFDLLKEWVGNSELKETHKHFANYFYAN